MDQESLQTIRATLDEERESIERQLAEHGASASSDDIELPAGEAFADSGQATAERSEAIGMIEQLRSAHREVAGALARIAEGTYGKCENCGQQIPPERLVALPATRLCVACKQALGEGR